MFRGVAQQLHAINRQQRAPDQSRAIAHRQDRRTYRRDIVAERADELGNRCEVRRRHAAQRHERHVRLADPLDRPAPHHALRVREAHDLESHGGGIRRRARGVIPASRIAVRQIHRVIEHVIQRVLERTGE